MTAARGPLGEESAPGPREKNKARFWYEFLGGWGLVMVLALIPALPLLLGTGLVNTRAGGDSPFLLVRVDQLVRNLKAGVFPARWMPHAAYGLGYPFFNFYASLPYYLAAVLKLAGIGYIWAIKLTQALGFIFAALALYALCLETGHGRTSSLFAALVYSCAPFHMVNIYVRGDSLSEFYAFVFFPLILWALLRLQKQLHKEPARLANSIAAVALSYAGLMLTHNISALIFTPFVVLYTLWLAWNAPNKLKYTATSWAALATGALLSAWFWLPALAETRYVQLEEMTTGYFHYTRHFRSLDLVQRSILFDYTITADRQPFCAGLVQVVLAAAGMAAIVIKWIRQRHVETQSAFGVFLLAISTWMITPLSQPLWDHLPLLPMVQFPWRFLSIQALGTSLMAAHLVPRKLRRSPLVLLLLSTLVAFSALGGLHPERLLIQESDITTERLMLYEYFTANIGTTIRNDYLPRWVDPRPFTSEAFWQVGSKPAPLAVEGQVASATLIALGPTSERWLIEVTSPQALLAFHTYYYPGWEALVDGQRIPVDVLAGLGYIGLRLSQGLHEVLLYLGRTRIQLIAETLSALTTLVFVAVITCVGRRHKGTLAMLAVVFAIIVLLITQLKSKKATTGATDIASHAAKINQWNLSMDFDRVPYLHHNPDGIRFGHTVRLISYELSALEINAGELLTVTTRWSNTQNASLRTEMALVSPAQHLFGVPQIVAIAEEPLVSDHVTHILPIPQDTMRGIYLLRVRVQGPEGEIRPVNIHGETLGTTYLLPVRIYNWIMPGADEPILHQFNERITLSKVRAFQKTPDALDVILTWQVFATPPQNYKIALRLKDPSGWDVARLDTQPGYGFYPTSMWRRGELVHDHYTLLLDEGTPPGASYSLQITLYESASLRPIGTATIPNVAIVYPTVRHDRPILHKFSPSIALSEAQLSALEVEQGAKLSILLKWVVLSPMEQDYEYCVALRDPAGTIVHRETLPLVSGYVTSLWPRDAVIASHYIFQLDRQFPVGEYTVELMVLESSSGKEESTFVLPTPIRITKARRNFAIPQMQTSVGASFREQVRLLGYDLQQTKKELHLTLYWQAISTMNSDYKVFVHLFDPVTEAIVAQQDILAGGEGYPTTRWVPQEVVSNRITLSLEGIPSGTYRLAVGLYDPAGRLSITAPAEFVVSADRLLLTETIHP